MNLNHLQYFLETCRYGSITKASEVCHISQPSITAAINNLEKELGAKLFDRVNNRLRLTVVGEGFKDLTEEFLKTFDDYCQSAYDIASSRYTKIRVGIPPFLSTIITKKLFPEFSVQHPNIRLEIVEVGLIDGLNKTEQLSVRLSDWRMPFQDLYVQFALPFYDQTDSGCQSRQ